VRYYSQHQQNRRDPSETHLEVLAKTRSLRNRTRPGMGNWLKKIIERETAIVPVTDAAPSGQVIGSPKKDGDDGVPTSDEDTKNEARKIKSSASRKKGSGSQTTTPASVKKQASRTRSARKSIDQSRSHDRGDRESLVVSGSTSTDSRSSERLKKDISAEEKPSRLAPEEKQPLSKSENPRKDATEDKVALSKSDLGKK